MTKGEFLSAACRNGYNESVGAEDKWAAAAEIVMRTARNAFSCTSCKFYVEGLRRERCEKYGLDPDVIDYVGCNSHEMKG